MTLKIYRNQMDGFEIRASEQWDATTARELEDLYASHFGRLGAKHGHIQDFCQIVRNYAAAYGVGERRDVFRMVVVALALGAHFPRDVRYRDMVSRCLGDVSVPSGRRLCWLGCEVESILLAKSSAGGLAAFGTDLANAVQSVRATVSDTGIADLLRRMPHIGARVHHTVLPAFAAECLTRCDAHGIHTPDRRFAYVACATVHGTYGPTTRSFTGCAPGSWMRR